MPPTVPTDFYGSLRAGAEWTSEYLPPLNSAWGFIIYALFVYVSGVFFAWFMAWLTPDGPELKDAIKQQIVQARNKKEEKERLAREVRERVTTEGERGSDA